jgi:hypothetical protein
VNTPVDLVMLMMKPDRLMIFGANEEQIAVYPDLKSTRMRY